MARTKICGVTPCERCNRIEAANRTYSNRTLAPEDYPQPESELRHECFAQYATLECTNGIITLISPCDFWWASCLVWHGKEETSGAFYVCERETRIPLHRLIAAIDEREVDHKNGNTLDNRRENLRVVTDAQQAQNTRVKSGRYKNVDFAHGRWQVRIMKDGVSYFGGAFGDEIEAALRADELMLKLHGEYARLNFPKKVS